MTIDEAIDWICRTRSRAQTSMRDAEYDKAFEAVNMAIKALEKQKTGHWIIKDGKCQGYDIAGVKTWYIQIMCDKCGFIKTAIEGHTGQYHYCPSCGARMELEIYCGHSDEEVAKSFIADVSAVEDQLEDKGADNDD